MKLAPLYAIVDHLAAERAGWEVPRLARAYLAGGARLIQLRAPAASSAEVLAWCDEILAAARVCDAQVIVNNRVDIARLAGADGVHVGQNDLAVSAVRRLLPARAVVGVSTHTRDQVDLIRHDDASYVAVGPVYPTATKRIGYEAVGLALVEFASTQQPLPVVGIGGITLERAPAVIRAGASAVAVISDLLAGDAPVQRVGDYVAVLGAGSK